MTKKLSIQMESPDGRPWVAESEVEAFELMAHGYKRLDDGEQAPPAEGADQKLPKTPAK